MDINGGQSGVTGQPIWPGSVFTGPLIAGNVVHSDGSGTFAAVGETTGTANQGYCQMAQTHAGITQTTTPFLTNIVLPAQSQILAASLMVTTAATGTTWAGLQFAAAGTSLTPALTIPTGTTGQVFPINVNGAALGTLPIGVGAAVGSTAAAVWDNIGNSDQQVAVAFPASGSGVFTLTVMYLQAINNAS